MDVIHGRNAVLEMLRADRREVRRLILAKDAREGQRLRKIVEHARLNKIPLERVDRAELDLVAKNHQSVVAETSTFPYAKIADILAKADEEGEAPLVLLLDILQDPQNAGTLIRTAFAVGVHGVIFPPKRSVGITPGVVAASAGMCEHMLVAVGNIAQTIRQLKRDGLWIIGLEASAQAQKLDQLNLSGGIGLVIGGEERGMRRLVRESCDALVRLPMRPGIDSLNASVAGSIVLYALWQVRGYGGADVLAP
jgi:23S rRNA (guanosine2251-2'-O)-methyltransferase